MQLFKSYSHTGEFDKPFTCPGSCLWHNLSQSWDLVCVLGGWGNEESRFSGQGPIPLLSQDDIFDISSVHGMYIGSALLSKRVS